MNKWISHGGTVAYTTVPSLSGIHCFHIYRHNGLWHRDRHCHIHGYRPQIYESRLICYFTKALLNYMSLKDVYGCMSPWNLPCLGDRELDFSGHMWVNVNACKHWSNSLAPARTPPFHQEFGSCISAYHFIFLSYLRYQSYLPKIRDRICPFQLWII